MKRLFKVMAVIAMAIILVVITMAPAFAEYKLSPWKNNSGSLGESDKRWRLVFVDTADFTTLTGTTLTYTTGNFTNFTAPLAVATTDLAADSVTTAKILNATIATADIATAAITTGLILNATVGTIDLAARAVTAAKAATTVETITITNGNSSGTATVTSGALIIGFYPWANVTGFGDIVNKISISSTTMTLTVNGTTSSDTLYKVVTLEP